MARRVKAPGQETTRAPRKRTAPIEVAASPSSDAIRARAYELFERRGGEPGHELDDWLEAERELYRDG
jgi:hypothetical protein